MQAVLEDWQINRLTQVFQADRLEIPASNIEIPSALQINWEQVASPTPQGADFPHQDFLTNINEYKQNRFLHIGNMSSTRYKIVLDKNTLCRRISKLPVPVQRDPSIPKRKSAVQGKYPRPGWPAVRADKEQGHVRQNHRVCWSSLQENRLRGSA